MKNIKFSSNTKNEKLFKNTYWGNFELSKENNKYEDFEQIFKNRDLFVDEYKIVKNTEKKQRFICEYLKHLEKTQKMDHTEVYIDSDGKYIIVNSPYGEEKQIKGFEMIYKLYASSATTYIKKITKEEMKNEIGGKTQKEFMKDFIEKEKGKIYTCEICKGTYSYFNKSTHIRTKRHLKFIE